MWGKGTSLQRCPSNAFRRCCHTHPSLALPLYTEGFWIELYSMCILIYSETLPSLLGPLLIIITNPGIKIMTLKQILEYLLMSFDQSCLRFEGLQKGWYLIWRDKQSRRLKAWPLIIQIGPFPTHLQQKGLFFHDPHFLLFPRTLSVGWICDIGGSGWEAGNCLLPPLPQPLPLASSCMFTVLFHRHRRNKSGTGVY